MRPLVTAVIAAIEAVAAAAVGLAVVTVPALLLWVVTFSLSAEPATVFAGAAGTWALAHFAPLSIGVSPELALSFGLAPAKLSFVVSLAPLGITLITALFAVRSGWRLGARGGAGGAGVLGGTLGFGAVAMVAAKLADSFLAWPAPLVGLVAGLVYGVPAGLAFVTRAAREEHPWWRAVVRTAQRAVEGLGFGGAAALPARAAQTLRLAVASLAALVGLAAAAVTVALATGYGGVVALTQHLQLDPLGSTLLFLAQLALLPVAVVWGMAWLSGSGFAVGAGTSVTPFETLLGPVPALPIFGAIPQGWGSFGALAPALVVLAGVGVAILLGRQSELRRASWPVALAIPAIAAVWVGLIVAGISALGTGAIGPERLAVTGPEPWVVGGLAAAELGGGLLLGTVAIRIDASRLRETLPALVPEALRDAVGADQDRVDSRGAAARAAAAADAQLTEPLSDVREGLRGDRDWGIEADRVLAEEYEAGVAVDAVPGAEADPSGDLSSDEPPVDGEDPREDPTPAEGTDTATGADLDSEPETPEGADADRDPEHDSADEDGVSETEALRAYSWDEAPDPAPETGDSRSGWRWPRPGR